MSVSLPHDVTYSPSAGLVGTPQRRVDGRVKVTGAARYAAEAQVPGLLHGYVVSSAVARGSVRRMDLAAARAVPGVVEILTHENRPKTAWRNGPWQDDVAPPGTPFRPLWNKEIHFSGQPVALVIAEDFETARHAATLVQVEYDVDPHETDVTLAAKKAYVPPKKRSGIEPPPSPRGDADAAYDAAPHKAGGHYRIGIEHHNPIEMHASIAIPSPDGGLTIYDKIQGVQNTQSYVSGVFGLSKDKVRVLSPYVGGAFGSGLRPHHQLTLAVMAALKLQRPVRVMLTRDQTFSLGYRPDTLQEVRLGADASGTLTAVRHDVISNTSNYEDYQESIVNWSGLLHRCDNVALTHKLAKTDLCTPADMRAPGAPTGTFAFESAVDELAYKAGMDPLAFRMRNYAEEDGNKNRPFTSKELRAAYQMGAERFGWSRRSAAPRSMKEGRELTGWGVATGAWEAQMATTSARAVLTADGGLEVATASADIGTGTYTIMTQVAADALGLPMNRVTALLGDSSLPKSPVEGGSWAAASVGSAVAKACRTVQERVLKLARKLDDSPLGNASIEQVVFCHGRIALLNDPSRGLRLEEVLQHSGTDRIEAEETVHPDPVGALRYSGFTHSACFAEVRVDEELGQIRVTRVVNAVAAGKILNPQTARSQVMGAVVMGIGMALHEETLLDHVRGRFMNHNLAEYHVPVNADIHDIDVLFVDELETRVSPIGVKGLGEIGIVATPAAIANAVFHATGLRVRELPITMDRLMKAEAA
ncbi:xanthine dehydrogenase family protein molybdopterin-binding subunit [Roseomonas sp. CCTCC AB2023176]|uniref:xanthine dehydrogenase family protein molybdopterin-binding subunit n=1 Tax=Roseomonas sp. CCTCC AB2023176 TaxID=3342640 RepID=UPI0035D5C6F4